MLQRWRWFCLLRGPSAGALTIGRTAGWRGGSRGSASPRSEGGITFTPKPQPNHLAVRRAMSSWDAHKSCKGKKISSSCLSYVWWERRQPTQGQLSFCATWRTRGSGSVSSFTWWKIRRTRELHLRACMERERPMNSWMWWERLKSPVHSVRKPLLPTNHCKEKTKGAGSIHC